MTASREPELCGEVSVESFGGAAYLQKWWSHQEHAERLRFSRDAAGDAPPADVLISEAELVGLIDSAWGEGLLSDFARRQLFYLLMRRYEEDPAAVWAAGPPPED
jgi:hypothetical protein